MKQTTAMRMIARMTFAATILVFAACANRGEAQKDVQTADTAAAKGSAGAKDGATPPAIGADGMKAFLHSTSETYGWATEEDSVSLDFLPDGRLHIQGPDGEATMWEGKWKLNGDSLTMDRPDLKRTETVAVRIEGDRLRIGGKSYTRYAPGN